MRLGQPDSPLRNTQKRVLTRSTPTVLIQAVKTDCFLWCAALAASAARLAAAPATAWIGGLKVPATSALVRHEHPRLLFTKADLPAIRARIANPALNDIYGRWQRTVDAQLAQGMERVQSQGAASLLVPLGLLYHLTGNPMYGQACRELTLRAPFGVEPAAPAARPAPRTGRIEKPGIH